MKKKLNLFILVTFSSFIYAQSLSKPSLSAVHKSYQHNLDVIDNEINIPTGTICFEEIGSAKTVITTKTNYICSIKKFSNQTEAETYSKKFKNSDSNISDFSYIKNENGFFFFNFSISEPKDFVWYLQLFKNNSLQFIKWNNKIKSIDDLISK